MKRSKVKTKKRLTETQKQYLTRIKQLKIRDELDLATEFERYPQQIRSTINALVKAKKIKITGSKTMSYETEFGTPKKARIRTFKVVRSIRKKRWS